MSLDGVRVRRSEILGRFPFMAIVEYRDQLLKVRSRAHGYNLNSRFHLSQILQTDNTSLLSLDNPDWLEPDDFHNSVTSIPSTFPGDVQITPDNAGDLGTYEEAAAFSAECISVSLPPSRFAMTPQLMATF